jgi:integrase
MRLTTQTIDKITVPPGKTELTVLDERLPNFGLRVRSSGARTWIVAYRAANGLNRRLVLGSAAELNPTQAFRAAQDALAMIRLGTDVVGEKQATRDRAGETFGLHLPRYLETKAAKLAPRSMVELERFLNVYAAPWHRRPIADIDRRLVAVRLSEIARKHGPGASNRFRAAISGYLGWAMREGLVETNPVTATNKQPEAGARERVLADAELAKIWRAADNGTQYGAIVHLLMLLGCRREEIGGLKWSEIEGDLITLPPERTKSGKQHFIPLPAAALEILTAQPRREDRDHVFGNGANSGFSGWSKSKGRLAVDGVDDWTLHDFRRSFSTWSNEHGADPHLVEAQLGHTLQGVAATYNLATHLPARCRLLERWAEHLGEIVAGKKPAAVIKLRK